jgi:hypothetical protein
MNGDIARILFILCGIMSVFLAAEDSFDKSSNLLPEDNDYTQNTVHKRRDRLKKESPGVRINISKCGSDESEVYDNTYDDD